MPTSSEDKKPELTPADRKAALRLRALWDKTPLKVRGSQEEVARLWPGAGITQSAVNQYLNGKRPLNYLAVMIFARALRVHPTEIRSDLPEMREEFHVPLPPKQALMVRDRDDSHSLHIPRFDVRGSMGIGIPAPDQETIVGEVTVSLDWVRKDLRQVTSPRNLAVITGYGDSMDGTFSDGAQLIVDRGVNEVKVDAVYVLALNDELYIKRLQRRPNGSILMISDNRKYEPYLIEHAEKTKFMVLGRVVGVWNFVKL